MTETRVHALSIANRAEGMQVGDAVVVTKDGVRKLGKAKIQLYIL